jgi:hypothetical protein
MRPSIAPLAVVVAAGCYSYRLAPVPAPERALMRVRFETPRTLPVVVGDRDTVNLRGITAVAGRVVAGRGDTLELAVDRVWRQGERPSVISAIWEGARAVVVPDPTRPAEQRAFSVGRTLLLVAGIAAAAAVAVVAAFIAWFLPYT